MAQFTVTVNAYVNLPPSSIGFNTILIGDPLDPPYYVFQVEDFTTDTTPPYIDPEGDAPSVLRILTLPSASRGHLEHNNVQIVAPNYDVPWQDVIDGKLEYIPTDAVGEYNEFITFDIADVGSGSFSGLTGGNITFDVGNVRNLPPTIGDGYAQMDYQGTLVFTREMFTTLTSPPYSDPEGDLPLQLKILSLPEEEGMKLNGIPVVVNQVISFDDIDAGLFTYTNDDELDIDGDTQLFDFAISDVGSGEFSE